MENVFSKRDLEPQLLVLLVAILNFSCSLMLIFLLEFKQTCNKMMKYSFIRELLDCFVEQSSRVSCSSVLLGSCYSDNVPLGWFMVVVNYLTITVDGCRVVYVVIVTGITTAAVYSSCKMYYR